MAFWIRKFLILNHKVSMLNLVPLAESDWVKSRINSTLKVSKMYFKFLEKEHDNQVSLVWKAMRQAV